MDADSNDQLANIKASLEKVTQEAEATFGALLLLAEFAPDLYDILEEIAGDGEAVLYSIGEFYHDARGVWYSVQGYQALVDKLTGETAEHSARNKSLPPVALIAFIDFAAGNPVDSIAQIRKETPTATFVLYYSQNEYEQASRDIHPEWLERFNHYYTIRKDNTPDLKKALRRIIKVARPTAIRSRDNTGNRPKVFVSYSRQNTQEANQLVDRLRADGFTVWIDHSEIRGSNDWLDEINTALADADFLVLLLSDDALASKYVKMEYRYFFTNEKTIVPVKIADVEQLPAELAGIQFIDMQTMDFELAYTYLFKLLLQDPS